MVIKLYNFMFHNSIRAFSIVINKNPKVCIIGAGPAGFYSASHIVKRIKGVEVDIFEKLPVPFGLVRFGVAPDHPEVKNVISSFTKTAENPQVKFLGNVTIGKDLTLTDVLESYDFVLLTYGANFNRELKIPGESLPNVIPARRIVGWYNGVPDDVNLNIDLSGENVAIIGQGNVAIDVARILLQPIDNLKTTDITEHALEALKTSKVKRVYLIGRRGPLQAAFTIKELREMLKLTNCNTVWNKDDFKDVRGVVSSLERPKRRLMELMLKSVDEHSPVEHPKQFYPLFYQSPIEISGKNNKKLTLGINRLEQSPNGDSRAILTDLRRTLNVDLVVTSIGYKAGPLEDNIPFDMDKGVVKNINGVVQRGMYAAGWVATGPKGVILTTMNNSFGVGGLICKEIEERGMESFSKPGFEGVKEKLKGKGVQVVTWKDWLKIDKEEVLRGAKKGKVREKIVSYDDMLKIAFS